MNTIILVVTVVTATYRVGARVCVCFFFILISHENETRTTWIRVSPSSRARRYFNNDSRRPPVTWQMQLDRIVRRAPT